MHSPTLSGIMAPITKYRGVFCEPAIAIAIDRKFESELSAFTTNPESWPFFPSYHHWWIALERNPVRNVGTVPRQAREKATEARTRPLRYQGFAQVLEAKHMQLD
ncbi:hypothetical protein P171DRAFT_526831 [Karstenula rhodostoma CBS 690.94]|uniref:Uncharacterized protein n=1 Tax=Karstenula rhodostoma CBS 690.94 TaxID=1392251 RepID=A0A9P4P6G6_9PLEO|nr:hypothetical protein P171DRAFT_526831 [Karstenula rhodostoma CBS 690.94]